MAEQDARRKEISLESISEWPVFSAKSPPLHRQRDEGAIV
jgi:hypothetical protein